MEFIYFSEGLYAYIYICTVKTVYRIGPTENYVFLNEKENSGLFKSIQNCIIHIK